MNTSPRQHTEKAVSVGWLIRCATAFLVVGAACVAISTKRSRCIEKQSRKIGTRTSIGQRENELKHQAYAAVVSPKYLEAEVRHERSIWWLPRQEDILSLPLPEPESVRSHAPSSAEANLDENALRRSSGLVWKESIAYMPWSNPS